MRETASSQTFLLKRTDNFHAEEGEALKEQATGVPCEMEGALKLGQDELKQLKELLDKAVMGME